MKRSDFIEDPLPLFSKRRRPGACPSTNLPNPDALPDPRRFPLNAPNRSVEEVVLADLAEDGSSCWIVSGFSGLDYIVHALARIVPRRRHPVCLLIGNEPLLRSSKGLLRTAPVAQQMRDYWLARGFSVHQSPELITVLEALQAGRVEVRLHDAVHAKLYIGPKAATIGSSNFSLTGMRHHLEANARFVRKQSPQRYEEVLAIAKAYWSCAKPANEILIALLQELLRVVDFEEALARACAELLEGRWIETLPMPALRLWPSQLEGIARAMWILENQGSVLIADATGSGKTRTGACLLRVLIEHLIRTGNHRGGSAVIIAPRSVKQAWKAECAKAYAQAEVYSDGVMSSEHASKRRELLQQLQSAHILAVDEAHRYLNPKSNRTQALLGNLADCVLLFTATPINRDIDDLVQIANLLGIDNIEPKDQRRLARIMRWLQKRKQAHATRSLIEALQKERPEDLRFLRHFISTFTVRRTKTDLKNEARKQPDRFVNDDGTPCAYPEVETHTYALNESERDLAIAEEIRAILDQEVIGASQLLPILARLPTKALQNEQVLQSLASMIHGLARYHILDALRSSQAALIEHLVGTKRACAILGIEETKTNATGNALRRLEKAKGCIELVAERLQRVAKIPEHPLLARLATPNAAQEALAQERQALCSILSLATQMDGSRDRARAEVILALHEEHPMLLAFSSRLISLFWTRKMLQAQLGSAAEIVVATGEDERSRRKLLQGMQAQPTKRTIALCSDALSEGVNLQRASALVMLDMPSTVRLAEQRIGRIDRLNSPHPVVHIWWPRDAEPFRLKKDKKFLRRYADAGHLLGANIRLPEEILPDAIEQEAMQADVPDSAEEIMAAIQRKQSIESRLVHDAFAPIRALIAGQEAIVPAEIYEAIRSTQTPITTFVAAVGSDHNWAFFCVPAGGYARTQRWAPRWVWLNASGRILTDIEKIASHLRAIARAGHRSLPAKEFPQDWAQKACKILDENELRLLPPKKRYAIEQMRRVLRFWQHRRDLSAAQRERIASMIAMLPPSASTDLRLDSDALASHWLRRVVLPAKIAYLQEHQRRLVSLSELTPSIEAWPAQAIERILDEVEAHIEEASPPSKRAIVAIFGVACD